MSATPTPANGPAPKTPLGWLGLLWGLLGVSALLILPIVRLAAVGWAALTSPLAWYHWLALALWLPMMGFSEGYRGFQKGFSPRVAARAVYLASHPTLLRVLLAPLFCIGYFQIARRRQITVIVITLVVIGFIAIARALPMPWRGIVDLGVVLGLGWGLIALFAFVIQGLRGRLDPGDALPPQ
jgi:hypothetical protein